MRWHSLNPEAEPGLAVRSSTLKLASANERVAGAQHEHRSLEVTVSTSFESSHPADDSSSSDLLWSVLEASAPLAEGRRGYS